MPNSDQISRIRKQNSMGVQDHVSCYLECISIYSQNFKHSFLKMTPGLGWPIASDQEICGGVHAMIMEDRYLRITEYLLGGMQETYEVAYSPVMENAFY